MIGSSYWATPRKQNFILFLTLGPYALVVYTALEISVIIEHFRFSATVTGPNQVINASFENIRLGCKCHSLASYSVLCVKCESKKFYSAAL